MRLRPKMLFSFLSLTVIILLAALLSIREIRIISRDGQHISAIEAPRSIAILEARLNITEAHLLLEEILHGYELEAAYKELNDFFDKTNTLLTTIRDGGEFHGNQLIPLESEDEIQLVTSMISNAQLLKELASQRSQSYLQTGEIDDTLESNFEDAYVSYKTTGIAATGLIETHPADFQERLGIEARQTIVELVAATLLSFIASVLFALFFSGNIAKRLQSVMFTASRLADGDLTPFEPEKSSDEIGDLSRSISTVIENLDKIVGTIIDGTESLSKTGESLTRNAEDSAASVGLINNNVEETQAQNQELVANVTETSAIIEEIARNIDSLNGAVQQQAAVVEQSSASIEEMISSIQSIGDITIKAQNEVGSLDRASEEGRQALQEQDRIISTIFQASRSLEEANQLISNISSQTNLLAMNAAIEAAHAGEAGKGFAVVSDEIRKLAEMTAEQSSQVGSNIDSIREYITQLVTGSKTSTTALESIQEAMNRVKEVFDTIRSAMQEQRSAGQEILEGLSRMRDTTGQVSGGSSEMKAGNAQMLEAMQNVNEISQTLNSAMNGINTEVGTVARSVNDISGISAINQSQIEGIVEAVNRFQPADREDSKSNTDPDSNEG